MENNYFWLVWNNLGILIICLVTENIIDMLQWFQHKCFPNVCWLYYHDISEFPMAACEKITNSISINIGMILLRCGISQAQRYYFPSQSSMQLPSGHFFTMSILVFFSRSVVAFAFCIFHVLSIRSFRDFVEWLTTKTASSIWPFSFLAWASAYHSVSLWMLFFAKKSLTWNIVRRFAFFLVGSWTVGFSKDLGFGER